MTRIYIYDTTLRDGAQTKNVSFSLNEKLTIIRELDDFGIDYIEGGWPGSNPTDTALFSESLNLNSTFTAFGMTNPNNLMNHMQSNAKAICLFGKTWDFQVEVALGITKEDNFKFISDSFSIIKEKGETLFDAEHFFDGFKSDPKYALECLEVAKNSGANWLVLCDTNGGTLPNEIEHIVEVVHCKFPDIKLGIHCHNDTGNAVANSLAAVRSGVKMIQGTINGIGERCGNADLITLISILELKMGIKTGIKDLTKISDISRNFDKCINRTSNVYAPFVGSAAFAHKGGVHASAIEKNSKCYEHIDPVLVGNKREIVISDQTGKSNIISRLKNIGIKDIDTVLLVDLIKNRDIQGYMYDEADASFELLVYQHLKIIPTYFKVEKINVFDEMDYNENNEVIINSSVSIGLRIDGKLIVSKSNSKNGPIHAIDMALRSILYNYYPNLKQIKLDDFRVCIINSNHGTDAITQVFCRHSDDKSTWKTLGVSRNIIEAAVEALIDAFNYAVYYKKGEIL